MPKDPPSGDKPRRVREEEHGDWKAEGTQLHPETAPGETPAPPVGDTGSPTNQFFPPTIAQAL